MIKTIPTPNYACSNTDCDYITTPTSIISEEQLDEKLKKDGGFMKGKEASLCPKCLQQNTLLYLY